ncbi:MAG: Ig-like domain-containing protein [Bacteroidales bacterium]|nr:Ig-like domain-containing protein [Bacteroidales bacterium]
MRKVLQLMIAAFVAAILVSTPTSCKKETPQGEGGKATGIALSHTEIQLTRDAEFQLSATLIPANVSSKIIVWRTSDESVASVTDGKVKAHKDGKATITARPYDNYFDPVPIVATCEVTVETIEVRELNCKLDANTWTVSLTQGTFQLHDGLEIIPQAADQPGVLSYQLLSGEGVVSLSKSGEVTPKAVGTAMIKATATKLDGTPLSVTVKIVVQEADVWPTAITFKAYDSDMQIGSKQRIMIEYTPSTANRKEVEISSFNINCVKVTKISNEEFEVEALAVPGGAFQGVQIIAMFKKSESAYGTNSPACYIYPHEGPPSLSIPPQQATAWGCLSDGMVVGEEHQLKVDYQNLHGDFTYSSNDPSIISIDGNGKMTACSAGATRVYVHTPGDRNVADVYVQVYRKPATIQAVSGAADECFIRFGGSVTRTYRVMDSKGEPSRQSIKASTTLSTSTMGVSVENYAQDSRNAKATFTSKRSSAGYTMKGTATVSALTALDALDVKLSFDIYDAMYGPDDFKLYDGLAITSSGYLSRKDGGYRGKNGTTEYFEEASLGSCAAIVVYFGNEVVSYNLNRLSSLRGVDGKHGLAVAIKNAYTAPPTDDSDKDAWWWKVSANYRDRVDFSAHYVSFWPNGKDDDYFTHTTNSGYCGYAITQGMKYYNGDLKNDNYSVMPIKHIVDKMSTNFNATSCSGWYLPTYGEWGKMLSSFNNKLDALNERLTSIDGGQGIYSTYDYWACQEDTDSQGDPDKNARCMTGISNNKTKSKNKPASTRAFLAF